jgi:sugar phosphate isomerase/epimerase
MRDSQRKQDPWKMPFHYCPLEKAEARLGKLRELGIGIELMLDESRILWPEFQKETVSRLAERLAKTGVPALLHGPFHNLNLGARDSHIRDYSRELILRGFDVARIVNSPTMVIHLAMLPQYSPESADAWWRSFSSVFPEVIAGAEKSGVLLVVENTYETDPAVFERIFQKFDSPQLGMCLDVGHAHCYSSVAPQEWAARLHGQIRHLHISDNDGESDRHWTLGKGTVDISPVLDVFAADVVRPTVTLEVPFDTVNESLAIYHRAYESIMKGLSIQ